MRTALSLSARRYQIAGIVKATPFAMIGYAFNVALAVAAFRARVPAAYLFVWAAGAIAICSTVGLRARHATRPASSEIKSISRSSAYRALVISVLLAAPWSLLAATWLTTLDDSGRLILIVLVVGMAASGSVLLSPFPAAALAYMIVTLAPLVAGLALLGGTDDFVLAGLGISFCFFLTALIVTSGRLFIERADTLMKLNKTVEDLGEARRNAERAMMAKSEFFATMSHEIRTPLNSIIGYTNLVLDRKCLEEDDARDLVVVKDAGRALLGIVNDVLDFSAIEAGQIRLVRTPMRLASAVEECLAIVRIDARKKDLTLTSKIDPLLAGLWVFADAQRLRQVLLNLLCNAIKFTSSGSVAVSVARVQSTDAGARVRFAVTDTGPGIEADAIPRLFNRFTQLGVTSDQTLSGSGLGLAICKSIVEAKGGEIGVESEIGRGSTFWFEITFAFAAANQPATKAEQLQPQRGRRLKVLVVDDLEANRKLAMAFLRRAGHSAIPAASGAEAISSVQTETFDAVLMDVQMPGMNGLSATKAIRSMPRSCFLPVIGMTANVLPDEVARCYAAGMVAHIGKPFDADELVGTVTSVVEVAETALERQRLANSWVA